MSASRWRIAIMRVGMAVLGVDGLLYAARLLLDESFYQSHSRLMVICAEAGLLFSVAVIVLLLIGQHKRSTIPLIGGSLLILYLWFSHIAWWVMVK